MGKRICAPVLSVLFFFAASHSRILDIRTYGAVAGDATDDRTAIQNTLNAAAAGDTVSMPAGLFLISGTLTPPSSIKVIGAGPETTIVQYTGASASALFSLAGRSQVEMARFTLLGNVSALNGITANNGTGHFLHHLTVRDFTAPTGFVIGIYFTGGVTNSVIADNLFRNMGTQSQWGGGMRIASGSNHNQVLRNTVQNAGRGGMHFERSQGNVIRENRISGSGLGQGGTNVGLGLEVWGGCDSSLIEDNVVDHWLSVDGSSYTSVRRNTVGVSDGTYKWAGLELVSSSQCVFTDNSVDDGAHIGISGSNNPVKDNVYWAFNVIRRATTWGGQIQGDSGGAHRHFFYGNRFEFMPAAHPQAVYTGQGHGLRFNGNGNEMTLDSNAFNANGGAALQLLGALERFYVLHNSITNNAAVISGSFSGLHLDWNSNTLSGNTLNNPPASRGVDNVRPSASFTAPAQGVVNTPISFASTSSDPDGTVNYSLWDFGEGLPSIVPTTTHVFARTGVFRVTLVVWDDKGYAARAERFVTVNPTGTGVIGSPHPRQKRMISSFPWLGRIYDLMGRYLNKK